MFDGLEGDDEVDGRVLERDRRAGADAVLEIWNYVGKACMPDSVFADVDADDPLCDLGEHGGAVSLAACDVEHDLVPRQAHCKRVAMQVFEFVDTRRSGD